MFGAFVVLPFCCLKFFGNFSDETETGALTLEICDSLVKKVFICAVIHMRMELWAG